MTVTYHDPSQLAAWALVAATFALYAVLSLLLRRLFRISSCFPTRETRPFAKQRNP